MRIYICDHTDLGMSGIALYCLDISAIQFQLIRNTAVSQAVKDHRWEIMLLDQLIQWLSEGTITQRKSKSTCHDQVIIQIFIP